MYFPSKWKSIASSVQYVSCRSDCLITWRDKELHCVEAAISHVKAVSFRCAFNTCSIVTVSEIEEHLEFQCVPFTFLPSEIGEH